MESLKSSRLSLLPWKLISIHIALKLKLDLLLFLIVQHIPKHI